MSEEPLRIKRHKQTLVRVRSLVDESCIGCEFENDREFDCPTDEFGEKLCYVQKDDHLEEDHIFIRDTPKSLADYIAIRMTGNFPEEDEEDEDKSCDG